MPLEFEALWVGGKNIDENPFGNNVCLREIHCNVSELTKDLRQEHCDTATALRLVFLRTANTMVLLSRLDKKLV